MSHRLRSKVLHQRAHILVIEDDEAIRSAVVTMLDLEGYGVSEASTFDQGLAMVHGSSYDVLLLDLALPGGDGLDILASMRKARNFTPVLILTARGAESDRVRGLRGGADDYLVKPFGGAELGARVEALLRRSGAQTQQLDGPLRLGAVQVDLARRQATWPAGHAELTQQEADLVQLLAERQQTVVPRAEVHALLWPGQPVDLQSRALDMAVRRLREKLGPAASLLVTVRGLGLRLDLGPNSTANNQASDSQAEDRHAS